jgi:antitoxin (DNA-binding transcriptional repressor) of toxin-antitoxin stability system
MISVNTHQAKTQLSHLLFEVETHHEIVKNLP